MLFGRLLDISAELRCMHCYSSSLLSFRIHFLLLFLVLLIFITIAIIITIIIYSSILCPTKLKHKGKRLHYLQCRSSLLNHGNMSMLIEPNYEQQISIP